MAFWSQAKGLTFEFFDIEVFDKVEAIRQKVAHQVDNEQDMYIFYNGRLLPDDCVVSDLKVGDHQSLRVVEENMVRVFKRHFKPKLVK